MIFIKNIENQAASEIIEILNNNNYLNLILIGEGRAPDDFKFTEKIPSNELRDTILKYQWEAEFFLYIQYKSDNPEIQEIANICREVQLPLLIIITGDEITEDPENIPFYFKKLFWNEISSQEKNKILISVMENRN